MQWPDLVAALSYYTEQEQPDASFTAATPSFVDHAELAIYRALDFLATSGQNLSLQTTALSNVVDLVPMLGQTILGTPVALSYPVAVQGVAAQVGNRWVPYQIASQDWLDTVWPDLTQAQPPGLGLAYYAMHDAQTIKLVPVPDLAYPLRITGKWRPAPMSPANQVTWLGANLADLLFSGVMAQALRYQRDFGAGSPDPQALPAWEARFQELLRGAAREELLKAGKVPDPPRVPIGPAAPQTG